MLVVILVSVRAYVVEAFAQTSASMVPTLFNQHATAVCPRCGNMVLYNLEELELQRRVSLQIPRRNISEIEIDGNCLSCGQTEHAVVSSLKPIPADRFLVVKVLTPHRWDLVAFRLPHVILIKRVIGMPGDSISIDTNGVLSINGAVLQSPKGVPAKFPWLDRQFVEESGVRYALNPGATMRLGTDEYFVIGDRAAASSDSRMDGPVHRKDLVGVATAVYWPLSRARILR